MLSVNDQASLAALQPGDHVCNLYYTEAQRRAGLAAYIAQGLERGEKVLYLKGDADDVKVKALLQANTESQDGLSNQSLIVVHLKDIFEGDGHFDPDRVLDWLSQECQAALAEGFSRLRVATGEPWANECQPDSEKVVDYEARLNAFLAQNRCLGMCSCPAHRLEPRLRFKLLASHPKVFIQGELYDNTYYIPQINLLNHDVLEGIFSQMLANLTIRQKAEKKSHRELARLQALFDGLPLPSYIWQKQGDDFVLIAFNRAAQASTEGRIGELMGEKLSRLYADMPVVIEDFWRCLHEKTILRREMQHRSRLTEHWKDFKVQYVYIAPDLILVHTEDISALKRAQEHLAYQAYLLENVNDAILATDENHTLTAWNKAAERMYGWHEAEAIGRDVFEVTQIQISEAQLAETLKTLAETGSIQTETIQHRKNGQPIYIEATTMALRDEKGDIMGYASVNRDITQRRWAERALRESEQRFRQLSENIDEVFWMSSIDGKDVIYLSPAYERIWGRSIDAVYKNPETWLQAIHPADRPRVVAAYRDGALARGEYDVEYRIQRPDGGIRWIRDRGFPIHNEAGKIYRIAGIAEDITKRVNTEKELRFQAELLNTLHNIDTAILQAHTLPAIAQAALTRLVTLAPFFGASVVLFEEQGQGTVLYDHYHGSPDLHMGPEVSLEIFGDIQDLRQGKVYAIEDTQTSPDQDAIIERLRDIGLRAYISVPLITQGALVGVLNLGSTRPGPFPPQWVNLAQEVASSMAVATQQTRLVDQVKEASQELRELSRRVFTAQEAERRRISRELHDEASQALMAVKISLDMVRKKLPPQPESLRQNIRAAQDLTDETMDAIRSLALGLRPPELEAVGLEPVLVDYCAEFARRTQLQVSYQGVKLPPLPDEVAISLYRVLQEALTNVIKHAHASQVRVELSYDQGEIGLSVIDDGQGFVLEDGFHQTHNGIGTIGMRERLEGLGGRLEIETRPAQGTRLHACVPWRTPK